MLCQHKHLRNIITSTVYITDETTVTHIKLSCTRYNSPILGSYHHKILLVIRTVNQQLLNDEHILRSCAGISESKTKYIAHIRWISMDPSYSIHPLNILIQANRAVPIEVKLLQRRVKREFCHAILHQNSEQKMKRISQTLFVQSA